MKQAAKKSKKAESAVESESQTEEATPKAKPLKIRKTKVPSKNALRKSLDKLADTVNALNTKKAAAKAAGAVQEDPVAHLKGFVSAKQTGTLEAGNLTLTREYPGRRYTTLRWKC